MTVFYVDPVNGNNSNNGQTFANRWKSVDTTRASYLTDGDEIRIIKTSDATSLGQATWTAKAKGFPSFSTISPTVTIGSTTTSFYISSGHNLTTGDPIEIGYTSNYYTKIMGFFEVTVVDANTFTIVCDTSSLTALNGQNIQVFTWLKYCCIKLSAPKTQDIAFGQNQIWHEWTYSTDCNASTQYQYTRQGLANFQHQSIRVNTAFGTGKAVYYQLPSTLDLSSYQQISFQVYFENHYTYSQGTAADNDISVELCTDNTGDTSVHSIPINAHGGRDSRRAWAITKDFGSNLSNNINSISIKINTAVTKNFDIGIQNVIACKDSSDPDAITLSSVITKSSSATTVSEMYPVNFVFGKWVGFTGKGGYSRYLTSNTMYSGTSETVNTYHRGSICTGNSATYAFYGYWMKIDRNMDFQANGITVTGGWDETSMSTRNGLSILYNTTKQSDHAFNFSYTNNVSLKNVGFYDVYQGIQGYGGSNYQTSHVDNCWFFHSNYGNMNQNSKECTYKNTFFMWDTQFQFGYGDTSTLNNCTFIHCSVASGNDVDTVYTDCTIRDISIFMVNWYQPRNIFITCTFDDVQNGIIRWNAFSRNRVDFIDCSFNNVIGNLTNTDTSNYANSSTFDNQKLTHTKFGGSASDHRTIWNGAALFSETTTRHTASGLAWKLDCLYTGYTANDPIALTIAEIFVQAGSQVTAKLWIYRSNANIEAGIGIFKIDHLLLGLSSDVTNYASSSSVGAWEEVQIQFTPAADDVAKIKVLAYGGSTHSIYFDDFSITQA